MDKKQKFSVRTDLAVEAREIIEEEKGDIDDGIVVNTEENEYMDITTVEIINENGSRAMSKPLGS